MSDTSPMMKKIRQLPAFGQPRFRIPKKGRIRLALAVVLAAVIAVFLIRGAGRTKPPEAGTAEKAAAADTREREREPKKTVNDNQMSFAEVKQLVKDYNIGPGASEQIIVVVDNVKGKGRNRGEDTLTLSLSIDTMLQKYASRMFERYKPRYGAAAAIDPATGRVLALASYAGEGEPIDGGDLYVKSIFPAASVFKTVVAAAGIEKGGMNAKTAIPHYGRHHTLYKTQLQKDLKVSRDIPLEDAFAYSVNPAFARIALFNVNKNIVAEYGERFGFNALIPFELDADISEMFSPDSEFSVAEFASGFNRKTSISPLFGALIAGAVCNGGIIHEPTFIDSIRSSKKDTCVYSRKTKVWRRAVKEQTASELKLLMTKVTHYGTARNTFRPLRASPKYGGYEFGGKTGSVNKQGLGRVDWFVGFVRNPNDKNQRLAVGVVTTHGEYWTVHSSYIAAELIKKHIEQTNAKSAAQQ